MRSRRLVWTLVLLDLATLPVLAADPPASSRKPAGKVRQGYPAAPGVAKLAAAAHGVGAAANRASRTAATVDPLTVARRVNELVAAELTKGHSEIAPRCSDEDFLRRVSFDIAGIAPAPQEVAFFGLDPDANKRSWTIDRLLATSDYAENWAGYWRDVVSSRATETRLQFLIPSTRRFQTWMKSELEANRPWDEIVAAILTATGDVTEDGRTAFIFAQRAEPAEVAAEVSRVFLGIQIQCANCHDHPTDSWKREQFHALAAFFPRTALQPKRDSMGRAFELVSFMPGENGRGRGNLRQILEDPEPLIRRFDRNGDHMISREEAKNGPNNGGLPLRLFELGADADNDGRLTAAEIKRAPLPPMGPGRGSAEYQMPDLQHPQSEGKKLDPAFFIGDLRPGAGLGDLDRRRTLARYITSPDNPWFARAFVNRIWAQLVGEGFYMPIDDIGPERTASQPEALEALSAGFVASGHDVRWLFRAICNTEAYQRQIRPRDPKQPAGAFASAAPVRLRADQLYDALTRVLGIKEEPDAVEEQEMMAGPRRPSPRGIFRLLFGFDPSTAPDELTGTIPQALFLMNSSFVNGLVRAGGQTRLHQLLEKYKNDDDALKELYLIVHAREPSEGEAEVCRDFIRQVNQRDEAFEDILWSLLNSTEFQTKR